MTITRSIINSLDRFGGRAILSAAATRYARKLTGKDVSIFFDEVWMHRMGKNYVAGLKEFPYYKEGILQWKKRFKHMFENNRYFWCYAYEPKEGDVIFDIGAGIGSNALAFSKAVGTTGRVVAVEAHPVTFLALKKMCQWNKLENVVPYHRAIMHERCKVYIEDRGQHESNSVKLSSGPDYLKEPVSAMSIDDLCDELKIDHIDYVKINVEGAEGYVINGMAKMIENIDHICIACHDYKSDNGEGETFRTKDRVMEFLRDHHFNVMTRNDDPRVYVRHHVWGIRNGMRC